MMKSEYINAKNAYEKYCLDEEYKKEQSIFKYVTERIIANKEEIEKILKLCNRDYTYSDVENLINSIKNEGFDYKKEINLSRREDGFVSGKYSVPIGIVGIESSDTLVALKYMLNGIKTRNAIIISDVEYVENDDKNLLLYIINEALKKYGYENLIQIIPYEDCDYNLCDKVIYVDSKKENKEKEKTNNLYIYVEDESLRNEAIAELEREKLRGETVEIIDGDIEEIIEDLNSEVPQGVVIYTTDAKKAYFFVNLVKCSNVFVNSTLEGIDEDIKENNNELLMTKKITYELKI